MTMRRWSPLALLALLLIAAGMACSLATGNSDSEEDSNAPVATADRGSGTTPVVSILSPADGQAVPLSQPVDIRVATDSTATSFMLKVNDRVASTRALPTDLTGPAEAILTWNTPAQAGTYTLEVIASNNSLFSAPATLTLQVSASAASTVSTTGSGCIGKALVSALNFRDGPSLDGLKLGQFEVGETVTVIGRNSASTWYRVQRANAQQVWVTNNAQWFQVEGDCGDLPLGDAG